MLPFELLNRYHLDAWNEAGEAVNVPGGAVVLLEDPLVQHALSPRPAAEEDRVSHRRRRRNSRGGWFGRGKKPRQNKVEVVVVAAAVRRPLHGPHGPRGRRRGPGDAGRGRHPHRRQLAEALPLGRRRQLARRRPTGTWPIPADRCRTGTYAATLQGPLLRFVHEDDRDFLLEDDEPKESEYAAETPLKPRHAPRAMMTAALYEMLCQAYSYVNSPAYRNKSGEGGRTREIRTLTLSYPSGMIQARSGNGFEPPRATRRSTSSP